MEFGKKKQQSLDPEYKKDIPVVKEPQKETPKEDTPVKALYPTEIVDLPSKGLCYPENNPLSKGNIELKYMTAKEEDILTSQNLIQKGVVLDKLLQELIVSDIQYSDLLLGDKNSIMIAARILAYGKNYNVEARCLACGEQNKFDVDLTTFGDKEIDEEYFNRDNTYEFELPFNKTRVGFKFLTQADEKKIEAELKALKNMYKKVGKKNAPDPELSTRLSYMITSVDDNTDPKEIKDFIKNRFLSRDSVEFRKHLREVSPDTDLTYMMECEECGTTSKITIPMRANFFWPDTGI